MNIEIINAKNEKYKKPVLNLAHYYVYEMAAFVDDWRLPDTGVYEISNYGSYWKDKNRWVFIIKVNDELAGFAMINTVTKQPKSDYNMAEFFITSRFKGKHIGKNFANTLFKKYPGWWEMSQIPTNLPAIKFWDNVISEYSKNNFTCSEQMVEYPEPHLMRILNFRSE